VNLGPALHVSSVLLGDLVQDVGVHLHFSLVLSGGMFEHAAKAAPGGSGECPVSGRPAA
jgi:hypothetical protein